MNTFRKIFFSFALWICFYLTNGAKINTPRVLLPWFENTKANFTFEINEGGCYTWQVSHNILTIARDSHITLISVIL